jgi:hypothetical protein
VTNEKPDSVDRMEFRLPLGLGGFSVSGRNASKLYWAVCTTAIILALGWASANIIGVIKHGPSNHVPVHTGNDRGGRDEADLPRRSISPD